jgi:hypothetical protein
MDNYMAVIANGVCLGGLIVVGVLLTVAVWL